MSNSMKEILDMLSRHEKLEELRATVTEQLIKQKNMLSHESILERLIEINDRLTRSEEEEKCKGFLILGSLTARIHADLHYAENEEEDEE